MIRSQERAQLADKTADFKAKIIEKYKVGQSNGQNIFLKYDSPPFFVEDKFDPLDMSQYFNEYFHA